MIRTDIAIRNKSFDDFKTKFQFSPDDIKSFIAKGESEGVKFKKSNLTIEDEILINTEGICCK